MSAWLKTTALTLLCTALLLGAGQAFAADATGTASPAAAGTAAPVTAPDIVASINVVGNKAVESAAILERMHTRVGDKLNRTQISRDVRRLYATGFFKDIKVLGLVKPDGRHLTVMVVENPLIASIKYEGLHEVKEKDLKLRMKLKPGHILNKPELQADINTIRKGYLKKGYYQVQVDPIQKKLPDGRVDLTMKITEGPVTRIKRIHFIGNKAFSNTDLADAIASRQAGLMGWFTDRDVFDRKRVSADQQMLLQHYMNNGFLDAKIESTLLQLTPDKHWFDITFSIHEGPKYKVNTFDLSGDLVPSKKVLTKLVELKQGDTYSLEKLRKTIDDITERVGDEGYAFATVTPEFHRHPEQKLVDITLDIEKGREVYVERIDITGNTKTDDVVIRREMRQLEGARFSSTNLKESKKRIGRLGFFDDVRVSMPKGSDQNKVKMKVKVNEKSTGSWSFGVGYSQLEKVFFRSSIRQNNLFGKGYAGTLTGDVGAKTQNFDTSFTDPYFLGMDMSASLNAFKRQTNLQTVTSYKENSYGGGFGFGIPLTENLSNGISYQFTRTHLYDLTASAANSAFLRSQQGSQTTGEVTDTLSWDTRNNVILPTEGALLKGSIGVAGVGGKNHFMTGSVEAHGYYDLGHGLVLNPGTKFMYIQGYGGHAVPIYRRFSLGGIGTVRGFDYGGITIRDPVTNDLIGGNKSGQASVNLFFPLPYMHTSGIRGLTFIDAGDVADFNQQLSFARTRVAAGMGIEWLSPVGPIGLTWGFVLRDQPGDLRKKFEFAMGSTF